MCACEIGGDRVGRRGAGADERESVYEIGFACVCVCVCVCGGGGEGVGRDRECANESECLCVCCACVCSPERSFT